MTATMVRTARKRAKELDEEGVSRDRKNSDVVVIEAVISLHGPSEDIISHSKSICKMDYFDGHIERCRLSVDDSGNYLAIPDSNGASVRVRIDLDKIMSEVMNSRGIYAKSAILASTAEVTDKVFLVLDDALSGYRHDYTIYRIASISIGKNGRLVKQSYRPAMVSSTLSPLLRF